jgi:hypothetical protein
MSLNVLRHYYLYAKGWYHKSSDLFADLKQIHAQWCGVGAEHLDERDVIVKLLELTYVHIKACSDDRLFIEFVSDIHPRETWKVGSKMISDSNGNLKWETDEQYYLRVARKCLSIFALTKVSEISFELGEADSEVLPLRIKDT